jgi:hypothetical protein
MSFLANIGRDCDSINGLECAADGTDESGHDTCKSASMDEPTKTPSIIPIDVVQGKGKVGLSIKEYTRPR